MTESWHIDAAGVLTVHPGFSIHKGQPNLSARRDEIKAIVVAEGISEIGDDWFCYLNQVRELVLPSTLRRIGKSAFIGCEHLTEVRLPDGVEELAESAFQDCSGVRRFCLPASLRRIGYLALYVGEGRLLAVDVARGNKYFTSRHGVLYNREMTAIQLYPCSKRRKEYAIPASVRMVRL